MRRFLFLLFAILPILTKSATTDFEVNGIYYKLISSTEMTVEVSEPQDYNKKYSGDVVIPNTVQYEGKQYKVTQIGDFAFASCRTSSVTIPSSVTKLGYQPFICCSGKLVMNCNLADGVVSSSDGTFGHAHFTEVEIGDSVKSIRQWCFYDCSYLKTVKIPNSVTEIGKEAFYGCTSLPVCDNARYADTYLVAVTDKNVTTFSLKDGIRFIGSKAFSDCTALTSIKIPNSVVGIGDRAFNGCTELGSIEIPESVSKVGDGAFEGCTKLPIFNNGRYADSYLVELINKTVSTFSFKDGVRFIGSNAFDGCTEIKAISIPESIINISRNVFTQCPKLESLVVNSGNKMYDSRDICNAVIETSTNKIIIGCKNTKIPNTATGIGDYAFCGCAGLTEITIPSNINSIGRGAFSMCTGLESINVESENRVFDSRNSCNAIIETSSESLVLGCKNSKVPENIKSIAGYAFSGCSGLTSIAIPNSVTEIGRMAFSGCSGLTSIAIPNRVTEIGYYAFEGCSGLSSVTFPNSVEYIGNEAFAGCSGLTTVNIGRNVKDFGTAFISCNNLKKIKCKAITPQRISSSSFQEVNKTECKLFVPEESLNAYKKDKYWNVFKYIEAIKEPINPVVVESTEITEQNAADITEFKMNLEARLTFAVNEGARVELCIGSELKATAEKKDISQKDGVVTIRFTAESKNAEARSMLDEFWKTVATSASEDVEVEVKVAPNSFKINYVNYDDELCYTYIAKASAAEKIENDVTSLDEIEAGGIADITYNLNGSRINGNAQNGIIIKNGNKVLVN